MPSQALSDVVYDIVVFVLTSVLSVFFREVKERGAWMVPKKDPILFVVAPHANQFVDPMLLYKYCPRRISFCMAQKSLERTFIGAVGRALKSIPVIRGQDLATRPNSVLILNLNDKSTLECPPESQIEFRKLSHRGQLTISHSFLVPESQTIDILSIDSHRLTLKTPVTINEVAAKGHGNIVNVMATQYTPHVSHEELFKSVTSRLVEGGSVAIFPEGGSHDRTTFLPFKPGPAIMALTTLQEFPNLPLKIVPVGLNYFHPDKFRSRAVIEFGSPIPIRKEWTDMYARGEKREAVAEVMKVVEAELRSLTVQTKNLETLTAIQVARRLYTAYVSKNNHLQQPQPSFQASSSSSLPPLKELNPRTSTRTLSPSRRQISTSSRLEITRRMCLGMEKFGDHPRVVEVTAQLLEYDKLLRVHGLRDHMVDAIGLGRCRAFGYLLVRSLEIIVFGILGLPCAILNFPVWLMARRISQAKAQEALKASTVKVKARDVLASWKIMVAGVMIPILYISYSIIVTVGVKMFTSFSTSDAIVWGVWSFFIICIGSLMTVRIGEVVVELIQSLKPLYFVIFGISDASRLRRMRKILASQVHEVINEFGPLVVPEFDLQRIVKQQVSSSIDSDDDKNSTNTMDEFEREWLDLSDWEGDGIFFRSLDDDNSQHTKTQ